MFRVTYEQPHDKTNKVTVRPAKTQISLGSRPVWSESSLSAWRNLEFLATHWAHSEDADQTGRMPRLIWVFAGRTIIVLVLSWGGSYEHHCVWRFLNLTAFAFLYHLKNWLLITELGSFNFQTQVNSDGRVVFVYRKVRVFYLSISEPRHEKIVLCQADQHLYFLLPR